MPRVRIRSDAPLFSREDYSYIMQCRDIKPRYKILNDLMGKYKTSTKRIYQIWRGEEANRVLWDQPIPCSYDEDSNHNTKCLDTSSAINNKYANLWNYITHDIKKHHLT